MLCTSDRRPACSGAHGGTNVTSQAVRQKLGFSPRGALVQFSPQVRTAGSGLSWESPCSSLVTAGLRLAHACMSLLDPSGRGGREEIMLEHADRPDVAVRSRVARKRRAEKIGLAPRPHGGENDRPCARCGSAFQPTLVRRLTCQSCYLANTDLDPIAWVGSRVRHAGPADG